MIELLDIVVKIALACFALAFSYSIVSDRYYQNKISSLKTRFKESSKDAREMCEAGLELQCKLEELAEDNNRLVIKNLMYKSQWENDENQIKTLGDQLRASNEIIEAANELIASLKLRNADLLKHNSNFEKFDGLVNNIENTTVKKSEDYYAIRNISEDVSNLQAVNAIETFKSHAKLLGKRTCSIMSTSLSKLAAKKLRDKGFDVNYHSDGFVYISIKEDA